MVSAPKSKLKKNVKMNTGKKNAKSMSPKVKNGNIKGKTVEKKTVSAVKRKSVENYAKEMSKGKNKKKKLSEKKTSTEMKEEQVKNATVECEHTIGKAKRLAKGEKHVNKFSYEENELMTMYGSYWVRRNAVPKLEALALEKNRMIREARESGKENMDLTVAEEKEFRQYMERKKRTEAKKLKLVLMRIAEKEARAKDTKKEEPVVAKGAGTRRRKSENPHKYKREMSQKNRKAQLEKRLSKRIRGIDPIIVRHCSNNLKLLTYLADLRSKLLRSGLQVSEQKRRLKMAARRAERIFKEKGEDFKISDLQ